MRLLAISDAYIPESYMQRGLGSLQHLDIEIRVFRWEHTALVELQQANLRIEQGGPQAVPLPDQVVEQIADCQFLVVQFAPVARSLIAAAESLKVIGVLRGGTENVDVDFATQQGIAVLNTPGRNARAVAECTLGLILTEVRNLARAHASLKQGSWRRKYPNSAAIPELNEKTVGLVGFGAVGRLVAGYLQSLGSHVLVYDPYIEHTTRHVERTDLNSLLERSDVVSLHARLTGETQRLIGRDALARMKPTAILVNTARSGLIDEPALITALSARQIMGAALDVFDQEPLPQDHPLVRLDNVTLTPHLAGSTVDAFRNSPRRMADHLAGLLRGDGRVPLVNGIRPEFPATIE